MAVKVQVKNFQSLRSTGLEISGFTAITGSNNSGKTALMRAITGVFQNTPGTAFVSHGADEMEVRLDFEDGRSVAWSKGTTARSKPTYVVDGGKPIHPGRGVPDEVTALGVTPIKVMGRDVWPSLAAQFTGQVFLLDQPGSSLAEAVADVERVARLNGALRSSERDLRAATSRLKVRKEDQARLVVQIQSYAGLDDLVVQVVSIEDDYKRVDKMERAHLVLSDYRTRLRNAKVQVARLARVEDVVIPDSQAAQKVWSDLESLRNYKVRLDRSREVADKLAGVGKFDPSNLETREIRETLEKLGSLRTAQKQLAQARQTVSQIEIEHQTSIVEVSDSAKDVEQLLGELGECPTCGHSLGGHSHGSDGFDVSPGRHASDSSASGM